MSTRREQLARMGAVAAGYALASAKPGGAEAVCPTGDPTQITARRTHITLPLLPSLGITYIALLDLFDAAGTKLGQASTASSIVDLTLAGPIVLASVVLDLADGQIHYQRLMKRFGDFPRAATGAIIGGTGAYSAASGTVDISWPDAETVLLTIRRTAPAAHT